MTAFRGELLRHTLFTMYSVWTRANAILFMSLSVLGILAALTTITTLLHVDNVSVEKLEMSSFHSLRRYRDKTDRATIAFDLKAGEENALWLLLIF